MINLNIINIINNDKGINIAKYPIFLIDFIYQAEVLFQIQTYSDRQFALWSNKDPQEHPSLHEQTEMK